jgi:glycosyltransferase involved in cell wall biosynthesis
MHATSDRRWTINGDFLTLRPSGLARYAREVTRALDGLLREQHSLTRGLSMVIVAPREPSEPLRLEKLPVRVLPEWRWPRLPQFWVQAQLPWSVEGGLLSFCNLGPLLVRRQILCIHDLQTCLVPDSYGRGFRLAHQILLPLLGRSTAAVTTVSGFSKSNLARYGVVRERKVVVTYNGHEHALRWDPSRSSLALGERPFVLALGRRERHKNNDLLRQLAAPLDGLGLDLCIAGDVDPAVFEAGNRTLPANLRLLGRVDDDDLARAFEEALCFLFPSRVEGFGLPALEAMARGCPVVASDAACLPEIYGSGALYAPPDDVKAWIGQVRRLKEEPLLRDEMRAEGRARSERYSWRTIAETYLEIMARIDSPIRVEDHDPTSALHMATMNGRDAPSAHAAGSASSEWILRAGRTAPPQVEKRLDREDRTQWP